VGGRHRDVVLILRVRHRPPTTTVCPHACTLPAAHRWVGINVSLIRIKTNYCCRYIRTDSRLQVRRRQSHCPGHSRQQRRSTDCSSRRSSHLTTPLGQLDGHPSVSPSLTTGQDGQVVRRVIDDVPLLSTQRCRNHCGLPPRHWSPWDCMSVLLSVSSREIRLPILTQMGKTEEGCIRYVLVDGWMDG
jgi:hypothetical protein